VDVTGAGDTVAATYCAALAAGADPSDATRLANVAGALVVRKLGTAVVSSEVLLGEILRSAP
jgi:bifunctional ADP-heptose synthase (sugar kinase/adenylyltransferase)